MTNREIMSVALRQSAIDAGCEPEDFGKTENVIAFSEKSEKARRYLELPFACNLISYGTNIVASVLPEYSGIVKNYIDSHSIEHCFETPNLYLLNEAFDPFGLKVCFMAEYFLPDTDALAASGSRALPEGYSVKILSRKDFEPLYVPEWSNALCADRKHLDMLGVGAYKDGKLVGLAGASADCDEMWQIGIDVAPSERRKGIASSLTAKLALEIIKRDIVPFYCCAWANIKSARNAIASGFRPAWAEMTLKTDAFIDKMNSSER